MGLIQSVFAAEGGYHVHGIQENSPAERAGLEPFFDFILSIGHTRLNKESSLLKDLLKANVEKPVKLEVYSSKVMKIRELEVIPSNMWGGQGLLGASVRFCTFQGANHNVWHVLDVEPNSPAEMAGLKPYSDYIVGADQVLQESEDFFSLIEASEGKALKLLVYNTRSDRCREVLITPNGAWGGEGSLGCGVGFGYLHRIPMRPLKSDHQNTSTTSETQQDKHCSELLLDHSSNDSDRDVTTDTRDGFTSEASAPCEKSPDVFETTSVDLSGRLDLSSSLIVDDDDDGGVVSGEDVSGLSQSEDSLMITTAIQKDDSGIYDIQTPPVILNMEPKDDEVVTFTPKTVT
ncbi:Golgi reassembly-stacking 1-like protein [Labeo rohita]|uniref:Golgi reassembly-stacking 1-like protein n=1 Tax=Labeo rohita TaxID=84645 RepID=A0A498M4Q5_LABRO|nr:Golgi reassembly-stacking protein 1b [Labeo rohita]RXN14853.1 Golgi reassembly-stacking 1-like protein [Labeo rohita]